MVVLIILASVFFICALLETICLTKQHRIIRRIKGLADEAVASKRQIIIEQRRNRQLKQEMTSNISHELKTPVSSIRGYLEILLGDKPIDDEKRHFFLERCYSQTIRLSDLIRDVSMINKLEEASELFPKEVVNVQQVAEEAICELEYSSTEHQIKILDHLSPNLIINGNKGLVYAIFRNLIENAINYAGDGIRIEVNCYREDKDMIYLHVFDTGCGVDTQYLEKIFDRFQRIDEGRSRKNGGTGLGLSIVKHAVHFHGGTIYAKNRDEGGLEFFFSLKK